VEVAYLYGFVTYALPGLHNSCCWVFGGIYVCFPPFSFSFLFVLPFLLLCYYLLFPVIWVVAYSLLLLA